MPDKYAPALFLEVLAFWFVLRWLLLGRLILFFGRLLVLMMVVGALATLDQHHSVWTACFAASGALAWLLLRRWRGLPLLGRSRARMPWSFAWRGKSPTEVATLCERRLGLAVDAAAPATLTGDRRSRCVLALAGDGVWVLEDESRLSNVKIGRVLACWDRGGLVSHIEPSSHRERFEFSWPRHGALVRGAMPSGPAADLFAGHLAADELAT
jgi:hypothetical protein